MSLSQPTPQRTYIFQAGQAAVGDQVNKEFDTLYGVLQGGIGDAFVASNASISGTKIASASVPASAIVSSTITDTQVQAKGISAVSIADASINSQQLAPAVGAVRLTTPAAMTSANTFTNKLLIPTSLLSLTCSVPSTVLINGVFDFDCNGGAPNDTWVAELLVDGVVTTGQVIFKMAAGNDRKTIAGAWAVPITTGTHKFQLDAYFASGSSGCVCQLNSGHTAYTYLMVATGGK